LIFNTKESSCGTPKIIWEFRMHGLRSGARNEEGWEKIENFQLRLLLREKLLLRWRHSVAFTAVVSLPLVRIGHFHQSNPSFSLILIHYRDMPATLVA